LCFSIFLLMRETAKTCSSYNIEDKTAGNPFLGIANLSVTRTNPILARNWIHALPVYVAMVPKSASMAQYPCLFGARCRSPDSKGGRHGCNQAEADSSAPRGA